MRATTRRGFSQGLDRLVRVSGSTQVEAEIAAAAGARCRGIQFAGLDLVRSDDLERWIEEAARAGLEEIGLRTNHLEGMTRERADQLVSRGLTSIEVPIVAPSEALQDRYCNSAGALQRLVAGCAYAVQSGLGLRVRLLLNRLNFSSLGSCGEWLVQSLGQAERVAVDVLRATPQNADVALGWLDSLQVLPDRLSTLVAVLRQSGMSVRIAATAGIPLCLLPKTPQLSCGYEPGDYGLGGLRLAACGTCTAGSTCPGIGRRLLQALRVQPSGLIPLSEPPRTAGAIGAGKRGYNQLREVVSFEDYLRRYWDCDRWSEAAPGTVYITKQDAEQIACAGDRAPRVRLARMPCLDSGPERDDLSLAPLAILVLAGVLRKRGFRVTVQDLAVDVHRKGLLSEPERAVLADRDRLKRSLRAEGEEPALESVVKKIAEHIAPLDSDLIGLSCETPEDVLLSALVTRRLKQASRVRVVLGGRVGRDARAVLREHPEIDWVIAGEGEIPLLLLASSLGGQWPLEKIPNLIYRRNCRVVDSPQAVHDLDVREVPSPGGLDLEAYRENVLLPGGQAFPYQFVRGCRFGCAFCGTLTKGQVRVRSPERVAEDLAVLAEEYGVRRFYFLNTMINATPGYLEALIASLERKGTTIEFTDCARPQGIDPALFPRLRAVGCVNLTWGLDAGTQRLQQLMNKGLRIDEVESLFRAAHQAGIGNSVNIIAGLPQETEEDRTQTLALVRRLRSFCAGFQFHSYRFLHTSPLYLEPERFGVLPRGEGFDEVGGVRWEDKQAQTRAFQRRLYEELVRGEEELKGGT